MCDIPRRKFWNNEWVTPPDGLHGQLHDGVGAVHRRGHGQDEGRHHQVHSQGVEPHPMSEYVGKESHGLDWRLEIEIVPEEQSGNLKKDRPSACNHSHVNDATTKKFQWWWVGG